MVVHRILFKSWFGQNNLTELDNKENTFSQTAIVNYLRTFCSKIYHFPNVETSFRVYHTKRYNFQIEKIIILKEFEEM